MKRLLSILTAVALWLAIAPSPAAEQIVHEVIIVADESPRPASPGSSPSAAEPPHQAGGEWVPVARGDLYEAVWQHPEQTFVDSEIGPLPLWTEAVFDEHGNPRPRFPDVFTKNLLDNPSPATALAYLESQRVRARRYLEASEVMQRTAADFGLVQPEDFRPPRAELSNNRALTPPYNQTQESWGVPVLDPQQARLAGLKREDIPETPGRTTTRYVEILYFWDHRCQFSMRGFRDYADFGTEIFRRELGPRVMTVSLDNDSTEARVQLDYLQWKGVETRYIENWLDQTELQQRMKIRVTPTYVMLDRRSGRIARFEGLKDAAFLRAALLELVDHKDAQWSDANPAWFRPVAPAAGSGRAPVETGSELPADATPVLAPSRTIKAWDPDGQSDK